MDSNTNADGGKKSMFMWIAGGCLAVVIGVGTCIVLLASRSKKTEEKKPEAPAAAPEAEKKAA